MDEGTSTQNADTERATPISRSISINESTIMGGCAQTFLKYKAAAR